MRFPILSKSRDEIKSIQFRKIKRILDVAYENSVFYKDYYKKHDFHPSMVCSYEDIKKIPIVARRLLKETETEQILTDHRMNKLHKHTTSGSSGIPVQFYYTSKEEFLKNYGVLRAYLMMGMKITDRTVALRDPIDISKPTLYQKMGIVPYDYYNIYDVISETYNKLCDHYQTIDVLKGMPSDLMNLCYQIRNGNRKFPKVKLLISDSEVLDDFSRQYISETIGTQILDYYASVENGCIAFQMPDSKKYFINEDQILLENASENANSGDAVITNLRNTTFPIIRYQIGDVIDFGDGESDLPTVNLKTIDRIHGKYLDFIVLPDKTIISPHVPKQELTHLEGIKKFQIIQRDFDDILIKIEPDVNYVPETEKKILDSLNAAFCNQVTCKIEYQNDLSVKTRNKFKCIQSDVAQQFLSTHSKI